MVKNFSILLCVPFIGFSTFLPIQAQSFDLRAKYIQGQVCTYQDIQKIAVTSDYFPGDAKEYTITSDYSQEVKRVHDDGSVELLIIILSSKTDGISKPPQRMDYRNLIDFPIPVELTPDLKVKRIAKPKNLPENAIDDFQRFKQFLNNWSPDGFSPKHNVRIGESWVNDQTSSYEFMGAVFDQVQQSRSTLTEEIEHHGKPSFLVKFDGNFSGTITQGMDGLLTGTFKGKRLVEKGTGQDLHLEMVVDQEMDRMTDRGNIRFQIHVSVIHKLINEESVSVR